MIKYNGENMNNTKGMSITGAILIVVILIGVGIGIYFLATGAEKIAEDNEVITNIVVDHIVDNLNIPTESPSEMIVIYDNAPTITLNDVTEGNAIGTAWLALSDDKTYHKVTAENLPSLEGDNFYEGWLVNPSGDFFSTGVMVYNSTSQQTTLEYVTDGDKTSYNNVVITLEPNDGNPAPAEHIIENKFPTSTDFTI